VYAIQSAILCEWNELEAALLDARQGLALGLKWGQADSLTVNYIYLSRALSASGDIAGARETLIKGQQVAGQVSLWFHDLVSASLANLHLVLGELDEVIAWSRERRLSLDGEISFAVEGEYRTLAWLLIEQGRAAEALPLLAHLLQVVESGESVHSTIQTLLLQALACQAAGNPEAALVSLDRALSLGEAGGFLRSYLYPGEPMRRLLAELKTRTAGPAAKPHLLLAGSSDDAGLRRRLSHLERILAAFPAVETQPSRPTGLPVQPAGMVEPISEREMEVLRYLAGHLTVPEIASALYVSPYTVRSHVKSIYGKLGVHNRSQAVQRARELGLL
jgi:ATP/maltotriose-dependent transcriptional regulator MalT